MISLANGSYSHEDVREQLLKHREIDFKYELLDKDEKTLGALNAEGFISVDTESHIKRVGRFTVVEQGEVDFLNERIRPSMGVKVGGRYLWYPLGVFLLESPSRQSHGGYVTRSIEAYDKSIILRDDRFTNNYYIAKGTPYTNAIQLILQSAGIINYFITPSALTTIAAIEFDIGTSKLDAINELAKALNYNELYVDVYGCFRVEAYVPYEDRTIDGRYATDKKSIVFSGASENIDLFNVPNIIVRYLESAEAGYLVSTVTNSDAGSPLSTVSRGRNIVDVQPVYDIADQTTLNAYTQRLMDEAKLYKTLTFETALMPHHGVSDCLFVTNKELNISGKYIETGWQMELKVGGTMTHNCRKVANV